MVTTARPTHAAPPALLPPFPNGWYCLALARDLKPGAVIPLTFMGHEIVLWRTTSGAVSAAGAYCPHLGAHLGHGGTVVGDCIRCPFHGFQYDTNGDCAFVPYAEKSPPLAKLDTITVTERNGLVLAHHDGDGRPPSWEVPALDTHGWGDLLIKTWRLRGHPQETTENSVDLGHFTETHKYTSVEVLSEATTDGPYLTAKYAATRPAPVVRRPVRAEFEVHVYGLGYSLVDVEVPEFGMRARLFVLPTPIDGNEITLRVGLSSHPDIEPARIHPLLARAPRNVMRQVAARFIFSGLVHDVQQDFDIWKHKRYVQPPILAAGDGPVGKYRHWAKQFYTASDVTRI